MGEEVRGLRSTNRQLENSHGDAQYGIGNGVAKELIHVINGYEQWWGDCLRELRVLGGGGQGGKIRTTIIAQSIQYNVKNNKKSNSTIKASNG